MRRRLGQDLLVPLVKNGSAVTTRDPRLTNHEQEILPKLATNVLAII
jgi:hypothetical protein